VEFVGLTNSPVRSMQPVRLEVVRGGSGVHAVFRVGNMSSNYFIRFWSITVEKNENGKWTDAGQAFGINGLNGSRWSPGYSCLYAYPWPPGLPTNSTWRLQLVAGRERSGWSKYVNDKWRRDIFPPYAKHIVASTAVTP
jgi:hypothetical protein